MIPLDLRTVSPFRRLRALARGSMTKALCVAGAALMLSACSSNPPASGDNLAVASSTIETARAAGAHEYAAVEISNANAKLERAKQLAQAGKHSEAAELADEAEVDARVAYTKAALERSERALAEVDATLRALRQNSVAPRP